MAEIRVEQKKRGFGWLWSLIALLVAVAMVSYFLTQRGAASADATPSDSARRDSASRLDASGRVVPFGELWTVAREAA